MREWKKHVRASDEILPTVNEILEHLAELDETVKKQEQEIEQLKSKLSNK